MARRARVGLALSGGGAQGMIQVGMLRVLRARGLSFTDIAATSVGAINGLACVQYDWDIKKIADLWLSLGNDVVRKRWRFGWLRGAFKGSKYDSRPLREYLAPRVNYDALRSSAVNLSVTAANLTTGSLDVAQISGDGPEVDHALDWVMRSAAYPLGLTPERDERTGHLYLDGGLREVTPVDALLDAGCQTIWVLQTFRPGLAAWAEPSTRLDRIGMRALEVMVDEIQRNDLARVEHLCAHAGVTVHVLRPERTYGDSLDFSKEYAYLRYAEGVRSAGAYMARLLQT